MAAALKLVAVQVILLGSVLFSTLQQSEAAASTPRALVMQGKSVEKAENEQEKMDGKNAEKNDQEELSSLNKF